jgi:hypothetical protein
VVVKVIVNEPTANLAAGECGNLVVNENDEITTSATGGLVMT